jgi:hypothetical protein
MNMFVNVKRKQIELNPLSPFPSQDSRELRGEKKSVCLCVCVCVLQCVSVCVCVCVCVLCVCVCYCTQTL